MSDDRAWCTFGIEFDVWGLFAVVVEGQMVIDALQEFVRKKLPYIPATLTVTWSALALAKSFTSVSRSKAVRMITVWSPSPRRELIA